MTPEELGGGELHCSTSGVADHLAESEEHAISITRSIVANLGPATAQPQPLPTQSQEPLHPPEELRGAHCCHREKTFPCHLDPHVNITLRFS